MTLTLSNGVELPQIGFGVFQSAPEQTVEAVRLALVTGTATSTPRPPTATSARSVRASAPPASTATRS